MYKNIDFFSSNELLKNPAFSQIAITKGNGKTIYISGQNAITKDLEIIGKSDITLQTEHALKNIEIALNSCNVTLDELFKLTVYITQGQDILRGYAGCHNFLSKLKNPPVISVIIVADLANPDYLVEFEAIAYKS